MKKEWQDNEREDATFFDFELIPRSGGDRKNPGDSKSRTPYWLCDSKDTKNKSFRVTMTHIRKIINESIQQKRDIPFLCIKIQDKKDTIKFVVLTRNDFILLKEAYENYKKNERS